MAREKRKELAAQRGIVLTKRDARQVNMKKGRLETLKLFQQAWKDQGINATLDVVEEEIKHDSGTVVEMVQDFLRPWIGKRISLKIETGS